MATERRSAHMGVPDGVAEASVFENDAVALVAGHSQSETGCR